MCDALLASLMDHFAALPPIWHVLWAGLACLSVGLVVLSWTRWGQSKPMHKCAVLSILAHVLLACFATTVKIVTTAESSRTRATIHVALVSGEEGTTDEKVAAPAVQPWEGLQKGPVARPEVPALDRSHREDDPRPIAFEEPFAPAEHQEEREPSVPPALHPIRFPGVDPPEPSGSAEQQTSPLSPAPVVVREREAVVTPPSSPVLRPPEWKEPLRPNDGMTTPRAPEMREEEWLTTSPLAAPLESAAQAPPVPPDETPLQDDAQWVLPHKIPPKRAANESPAYEVTEAVPMTPLDELPLPSRLAQNAVDDPSAPLTPLQAIAEGSGPRETSLKRPSVYRHRLPQERARLVRKYGGTEETEAAVHRALQWLARAQSPDGRWDPVRHGAGRETAVYGHDRQGAGAQADTGITGLALLAFLGAGHTHLDGSYQRQVQRGLDFLVASQAKDGNLGGDARLYARMYCHAMAAFAISEAYAMTGDAALAGPVREAMRYTIAAQHSGGGWRYRPGDAGDTSQLGWQLMSLRSAELAGMAVPETTWRRAGEFLQSVSRGRAGGLAAYQPGAGVSRPMSAEASYCKLLLAERSNRIAETRDACEETAEYLRTERPGAGSVNLYYWYYATLLLHLQQHDGSTAREDWRLWNAALQRTLLASQHQSGPLEGAWGSDTAWGGYGGRVYTTALAALCLETYYRYLPFLEGLQDRTATRSGLLYRRAFDTRPSPGKIE